MALFFSIIPLVGDAMAIKEGEDIAGQKLSAMEKSFAAVMLLMPNALEMVVKRLASGSADTVKWVAGYLRKVADTEGTMLNAAAKKAGVSVDVLKSKSRTILARLGESAPARVAGEIGNKTVAVASEAMDKATETWKAAKKAGSDKVNRIKELLGKEGVDEATLLAAYQDLRMDKIALDELQKGKYKSLREKIKKIEDNLFGSIEKIESDELGEFIPVPTLGKVDRDAIDGLKAGFKGDAPDELQELLAKAKKKMRIKVKGIANKNGVPPGSFDPDEYLDFNDLEITVFNATNKPPSPDKIGFDRDITYRVKIPAKKVKVKNLKTGVTETITIPPTEIDLPADVVSQYYNKNLYKHLNPGKTPPRFGPKSLKEFGDSMDHVVTDEFAIDSYRIGTDVRKFFNDPTLLDRLKSKGGDIGNTVTHKSREWFHKAEDFGPGTGKGMWHTKEGMRQATKQFDNYATSLQKYYDPASIKKIPPKLENGLRVFKKVKEGTMSVPEAERALQALGTNKEEVVELFGSYFEGMLKTGKRKTQSGGFGRP